MKEKMISNKKKLHKGIDKIILSKKINKLVLSKKNQPFQLKKYYL